MHGPVVAIVTHKANTALTTEQMRDLLEQAGPAYTNIPGLRRKYFLHGDGVAGGVYEWETRAQAEAFYDEVWFSSMTARAGVRPDVVFFSSPAIADGVAHRLELYLPR
jgi:hypothetical protein